MLASGLDNLTNDLPLHPVFVTFVDHAARYLSGTERLSGSRLVDAYAQLRSGTEPAAAAGSVEVIDPEGKRPLLLSEARTVQSLRLEHAGFYQIHFANGRDAVIGVNPDRRESDLTPISDDVLQLWSGSSPNAGSGTASATAPEEGKQSVSLWWYVMLLALLMAKAETAFATRYLSPAAGGSMSYASELHSYIARLQQRMRTSAGLRGAAIFAGTALAVTVVLVRMMLNHLAFPARGVLFRRLVIMVALASAAVFDASGTAEAIDARPRVHARVEAAHPELDQRLTTFAGRAGETDDPFLELLAADTLRHAEDAAPATLVPDNRLFAMSGAAAACLAVLVWIIAAGPGYLGYGASLVVDRSQKRRCAVLRNHSDARQRYSAPQ